MSRGRDDMTDARWKRIKNLRDPRRVNPRGFRITWKMQGRKTPHR